MALPLSLLLPRTKPCDTSGLAQARRKAVPDASVTLKMLNPTRASETGWQLTHLLKKPDSDRMNLIPCWFCTFH